MGKDTKRGMGLDVEPKATSVPTPTAAPVATVDETGRPYCERHNVLMRAASTQERTTYYKCPVDGCNCTAKRVKGEHPVPREPVLCGRTACQGTAMEVDETFSTALSLSMTCPRCGDSIQVPRPGARIPTRRQPEPIGLDAR